MPKAETITGYSGTTLQNFARCARIDNKGEIVYDKNGHPGLMRHVYFNLNGIGALEFVLPTAITSKDIPVIMIGKIPVNAFESCHHGYRLKEGDVLPVSMVLAPTGNQPLEEIFESVLHYISEKGVPLPHFYIKHHPKMLLHNLLRSKPQVR